MDITHLLVIVLRSVVSLAVLFFLTKILGKKQVSQLSEFDYVIGISMGSIAAEMTINMDAPFLDGITAMIAYSLIAYLISILTLKSINLRRFFTGVPVVLVQDGKIIRRNLRKALIDINDLLQECRTNGYFDIGEISYAIMETSGHISFLPKTAHRPATLKDLKLKDSKAGLCANVIIDGNIMPNNLEPIKKDESWLLKEIKKQGYNGPAGILLATVDPDDKLTIYGDSADVKNHDILE